MYTTLLTLVSILFLSDLYSHILSLSSVIEREKWILYHREALDAWKEDFHQSFRDMAAQGLLEGKVDAYFSAWRSFWESKYSMSSAPVPYAVLEKCEGKVCVRSLVVTSPISIRLSSGPLSKEAEIPLGTHVEVVVLEG